MIFVKSVSTKPTDSFVYTSLKSSASVVSSSRSKKCNSQNILRRTEDEYNII